MLLTLGAEAFHGHRLGSGHGTLIGIVAMLRFLRLSSIFAAFVALVLPAVVSAADDLNQQPVQEEVWALPLTLPTLAYVAHPVGKGPFPLVIMNHGVSLNARDRSF